MGSLYSEYTTWLHGWRAGLKLLLLAIGGTLLFLTNSPLVLAGAGLVCPWDLGAAVDHVRKAGVHADLEAAMPKRTARPATERRMR